jgi:hypothetical protein
MSNINTTYGLNTTATDYCIEYPGYIDQEETPPAGATPQAGPDFSAILADAMRDNMMQAALTAGGGTPGMHGGYMPVQNNGVEQAILAAASSGQIDDAQIALFMLMMMMQTSQDGEFSMLMQMMGTMIMQIQADSNALRSSAMASDFHPYVLDSIDRGVFNWNMQDQFGAGGAQLPVEHWRPTTPIVTSDLSDRSPERYRSVINQFRVESAERYRPFRNGSTYCNIFVWDVTRAMGAEIPMYTDPATGAPRFYPDIRGARSMGAIAMCDWLEKHGPAHGWREVDAETAQLHANEGRPAVTSAGSLGHVQMVCPSRDGLFDPIRGVSIAQAGRIVTIKHIRRQRPTEQRQILDT